MGYKRLSKDHLLALQPLRLLSQQLVAVDNVLDWHIVVDNRIPSSAEVTVLARRMGKALAVVEKAIERMLNSPERATIPLRDALTSWDMQPPGFKLQETLAGVRELGGLCGRFSRAQPTQVPPSWDARDWRTVRDLHQALIAGWLEADGEANGYSTEALVPRCPRGSAFREVMEVCYGVLHGELVHSSERPIKAYLKKLREGYNGPLLVLR